MSRPRSQSYPVSGSEAAPQVSPPLPDDLRVELLESIERLIARARELNLKDSVFLLNVARIDLKTKIHEISDSELHALSMAVRSELEIEDPLS